MKIEYKTAVLYNETTFKSNYPLMPNPIKILILVVAITGLGLVVLVAKQPKSVANTTPNQAEQIAEAESQEQEEAELYPMAIEALRQGQYPGGQFTVEQTLANGSNYSQMVVSYLSESLKIYGLLTIPLAPKPETGHPAVVFIHGHIPPAQYSTINDYPTYQAALTRGGFVTFKPDLRGHGNSEGEPSSAHYSEKYTIDTLNAIAYLKMHPEVDPNRLGYWGHSNGGEIGLRTILVNSDIKAASFWAGVVGSYVDMFETYVDDIGFLDQDNPLTQRFGRPSQNPEAWNQLDPYAYLNEINIPIQIQHGTNDDSVPLELSLSLKAALESAGKEVEYFEYAGDDHNIGQNSGTAWQRTINFYREHL